MDGELAISTSEHLVVVYMIPMIYCIYNLWKTSDRWIEYEVKFRLTESVFGSVVTGAFQITFRVKMHVNDVFLIFKNHFWHQHIKTIQNIQTILNFSKKKNQIFWERSRSRVPKRALSLKNTWEIDC